MIIHGTEQELFQRVSICVDYGKYNNNCELSCENQAYCSNLKSGVSKLWMDKLEIKGKHL